MRLYEDFIDGTLSSGINDTVTTISSSVFADLPVVSGGDTLKLVIDPDRTAGEPEIVEVTAHTASATSVTVTRGADGTTARTHSSGVRVVLGLVASDVEAIQAIEDFWTYGVPGTLSVETGTLEFPVPFDMTITELKARVGTAPTGAPILIDVNKNGTSVLNSALTIAAGSKIDTAYAFGGGGTTWDEDDYITIDIDQVGSTVEGSDLTLVIVFTRR